MALLEKRGFQGPLAILDCQAQWYAMLPLKQMSLMKRHHMTLGCSVFHHASFNSVEWMVKLSIPSLFAFSYHLQGQKGEPGEKGDKAELVCFTFLSIWFAHFGGYNGVSIDITPMGFLSWEISWIKYLNGDSPIFVLSGLWACWTSRTCRASWASGEGIVYSIKAYDNSRHITCIYVGIRSISAFFFFPFDGAFIKRN